MAWSDNVPITDAHLEAICTRTKALGVRAARVLPKHRSDTDELRAALDVLLVDVEALARELIRMGGRPERPEIRQMRMLE